MASVLWNAHWLLFIYYHEKGKTITGQYYASLLVRKLGNIKNGNIWRNKKRFLQDNAPAYNSLVAMARSMKSASIWFFIHSNDLIWLPAIFIWWIQGTWNYGSIWPKFWQTIELIYYSFRKQTIFEFIYLPIMRR